LENAPDKERVTGTFGIKLGEGRVGRGRARDWEHARHGIYLYAVERWKLKSGGEEGIQKQPHLVFK